MAEEAADKKTNGVQEVEVDGYKFTVDTDRLDDVEALEFIDRIESKGQVAAVLPLLQFILGMEAYRKMQAYFTEKDGADHAKEHPEAKDYTGRFRINKLNDVYMAIIEKFDPKG